MKNVKVPPPLPRRKNDLKKLILGVGLVVTILIVGYFLLSDKDKHSSVNDIADTSPNAVRTETTVSAPKGAIILPQGFECFTEGDWRVGIHALFRKEGLEFISTYLGRDSYEEGFSEQQQFKKAIEICFGDYPYKKTQDRLYVSTGDYEEEEEIKWYYYSVFVPEKLLKLTIRSRNQTKEFSDLSIFLLGQIRNNRNAEVLGLTTHDGKSCAFSLETSEN